MARNPPEMTRPRDDLLRAGQRGPQCVIHNYDSYAYYVSAVAHAVNAATQCLQRGTVGDVAEKPQHIRLALQII